MLRHSITLLSDSSHASCSNGPNALKWAWQDNVHIVQCVRQTHSLSVPSRTISVLRFLLLSQNLAELSDRIIGIRCWSDEIHEFQGLRVLQDWKIFWQSLWFCRTAAMRKPCKCWKCTFSLTLELFAELKSLHGPLLALNFKEINIK